MAWINDHQWDRLVAVVQLTAHHLSELRREVKQMTDQMKDAMDGLVRAVQVNGDRTQAAIAAFQGLAQQIHAAAEDPSAVRTLADQINSQSQTLADAISANTPGGATVSSEPLTGTQAPAPNPAHPGSIPPPPPAPATSGMGGSGAGQATTPATPAPEDQPPEGASPDQTNAGEAASTGPADTNAGASPQTNAAPEASTAEPPQAGF